MEVELTRLIIENFGKVMALVGTLSGALMWLGTSLWKLSRAVARFEVTQEMSAKSQEQMLEALREDRSAIQKLQLANVQVMTVLKLRHDDETNGAGTI